MNSLKLTLASGVTVLALSATTIAMAAGSNEVYTSQNGTGGAANTMDISQTGDNNKAGLAADRSLAQDGSGNALVVIQGGSGNVVGRTTGLTGPNPDGLQSGTNNTLRITQPGNSNQIKYRQTGSNNGNLTAGPSTGANGVSPFQGANYGDSSVNPTGLWNSISQAADGSSISLNQASTAAGLGNGIIINQAGTGVKTADVTQSTTAASNYAYLDQRNDGAAMTTLTQTNNGAQFNLADIRQGGSATVTATQSGYGLDLFVQQSGGTNTATTIQTGSANSVVSVFQDGGLVSGNTVTAFQTNATGAQLFATQSGSNNSLSSTQMLSGALATVMQIGSGNTGINVQNGLQTASITQTSDGNSFSNTQMGAGLNSFTLTQRGTGGHSATSSQDGIMLVASVDQIGSGNSYTGVQTGMTNTVGVQQGASGNFANVAQSGSNNTATIRQNR